MSYKPFNMYDKNDTAFDAWGRPKIYQDLSLLHGVFTYNVPNSLWIIKENGTELLDNDTSTKVYSSTINLGRLIVESGENANDEGSLYSRRSPRYQPNRGHLFSTAVGFPNPTADGIRDFGLFNEENGVFYRLKADGLYAVIRSEGSDYEEKITIPFSIDLSKGNIYDIQFQWRGVGDYNFFIGNPESGKIELVHKITFLNTLTEKLSISNPALPVGMKATNITEAVSFWLGCFDVSSEGGSKVFFKYSQVGNDNINGTKISNDKLYPVVALKVNRTFNGRINTRDAILRRIILSAKDENRYEVQVTRDESAFSGTTWTNKGSFDNMQYSQGTDISYTETQYCHTILNGRSEIDIKNEIATPVFDGSSDFTLTAGDYIVVLMKTDGTDKRAWASIEYTEEV